jgi:polyisoprenoid-binding protein YceI
MRRDLAIARALGIALLLACAVSSTAQNVLDAPHSSVTVRVYKTGLFSTFAHDHTIAAPISEGSLDPAKRTIELRFRSDDLRLRDKVSDSERTDIEHTMKSNKVLDVSRFPEIRFASTSVEPSEGGSFRVRGDLSLHGMTKPLEMLVKSNGSHYTGTVKLKQTDFGITPVSVAGGTVRVKNEIEILFEIVASE